MTSHAKIAQYWIEKSELLSNLAEGDIETLAQTSLYKEFDKGEIIWLPQSKPEQFGLVVQGYIKMSHISAQGVESIQEFMGPGQCFGLNGIIEGKGCPLQASSMTKSLIMMITRTDFMPIFERNVQFQAGMLKRLIHRFHEKIDILSHFSSGSVQTRIAAVLLALSETYGQIQGNAIQIEIPLTRSDIAEITGATTESVIRTLSLWQKLGLVATEHKHISLLDIEKISKFLEPS